MTQTLTQVRDSCPCSDSGEAVNNEDVRRVAANFHEELTDVCGLLQELEQLREVRDAVEATSLVTAVNERDLKKLNQEIADLERREQRYRAVFDSGCERLIPLFRWIAEQDFDALDSEDWSKVEAEFHAGMRALIQLYVARLERRILRSNEVAEGLLALSQNLPVHDTEQKTLPFPGVATRFGPDEDGKYTGIRIGDREIHLSTGGNEVKEFLSRVQETLADLAETLPDEVEHRFQHVDGANLQATPFFVPRRV